MDPTRTTAPDVPVPRRAGPNGIGRIKGLLYAAAVAVFVICLYAFLLGNEVFDGDFKNDAIGWYFLGKGVFCSLSLYLSVRVLETLEALLARV